MRSAAFILVAASTLAAPSPSGAQMRNHALPPENSLRLSEIITRVEQRDGFRFVDEVEWDRDGYYEVSYYTVDGAKVEIKLDPVTGSPRM
ncbi:PepSY domain-containing protein [Mesorhizobium sp. NBSH29]|uniref:PepSY domain-containing protein n=1 Tax=Mesorhizobium sp. NBSH29 TaxID=2654249 RepID=UPI001896A488|nr:PepSY domain-containing protein [Mesorhizobium sp. NBSH29]QPC85860.1 PepSY domain-containing protein [Mesorhizobium sp. NBSH29]